MMMKKMILTAAAGLALVATPLAAQAQHAGAHAGGFRAGGYHVGGYHGGFYRGGWGHYGYGYGYGAAAFGFALGAALYDPWYYGPAYYGYYGYYGPPAPVVYADPVYSYAPPPAAPQAACGQWSWDQAHSKYNWVPGPCAAAPAPVQVN